jgi:hypothetical protein
MRSCISPTSSLAAVVMMQNVRILGDPAPRHAVALVLAGVRMAAYDPELLARGTVEAYPIARVLHTAVPIALDRHKAGKLAAALGNASTHDRKTAAGQRFSTTRARGFTSPLPALRFGMAVTLDHMRTHCCWTWVHCANWRCLHEAPVALAPLIIR